MRLEQLRCIVDIAETGSLTATAQRQFITQQAVSKMIKQLEKELDATLLIRNRSGVSFTEIGNELVLFAQKVMKDEGEFQKRIRQIKQITHNRAHNDLYIASTSSITNFLLPLLIANTQMKDENLTIHINPSTDYTDVAEQIASKKSDLGFVTINETELPALMRPYQDELDVTIILKDKMIALMDKRYYTGDSLRITEDEFAECKVKTLYNIHPIEMFQQPIKDSNIICSGDADFHRNMMEKTGAVTLMSVTSHHLHFNNKKYVPLMLGDHFNEHSLLHVAIYRKSAHIYMEKLLNLMQREMMLEGTKAK